ncbi:hypothetical protein [uncultured Dokdonia sp.]|uniref:hypothetical protein n=1 Tax=uncultured Dokdonia sp. TaxID=575653 RepID=UPI00263443DD|nr:hypothetical protein [uncultured Dokdonia sp.]
MLVAESNLKYELEDVYILSTGVFYFFEDFIISEINEGVHFNWEAAQDVIELALNHYGRESKISYISNRIYSYSIEPQDWLKFFKSRHTLRAFAVVTYSRSGLINVMMEKLFFKSKIKTFKDLYDATDWVSKYQPTIRKKSMMVY